MLKHLDGDKCVKSIFPFGWDVPIIEEVDVDFVGEAGGSDPFLSKCLLLNGKGECINSASKCASRL